MVGEVLNWVIKRLTHDSLEFCENGVVWKLPKCRGDEIESFRLSVRVSWSTWWLEEHLMRLHLTTGQLCSKILYQR